MKRTYECMCLLDNREVRQGWQALKDNVAGMFTKHGHEIVSSRRWEERRLAFPVKHQQRGTYLLVYFNGDSESIAPLRRDLQLNESVLRNLILTCDEVPEEAHRPEEEFDESQVVVEDVYQEPPPPAEAPEEAPQEAPREEAAEDASEEASEGAKEEGAKAEGAKEEGAKAEGAKAEGAKAEGAKEEGREEAGKEDADSKQAPEDSSSKQEVKE